MKDFFLYMLQANATLAIGYAAYRLCGKDTFLQLRRTLLLGLGIFSLLCPLLSRWLPAAAALLLPALTVSPVREAASSLPGFVAGIYLAGIIILTLRTAAQAIGLLRLIGRCPEADVEGRHCRLLPEGHEAFSFLHFLCIPRSVLHSPSLPHLLRHEGCHIRQRHTADVLWSRLLCALCRFNPATALMVAANRPAKAKAMAESLTSAPQAKEAVAEPTKRQTDIAQVAPTAGKPTPVRDEVATPAVYPGGEAALLKHISQNITYPKAAMEKKIEGLVLVNFNIGTDGAVTDVQVARSLSPECDAEAVRVIKKLEKFRPARDKDGQPVVQKMILPIRYKIQ